MYTYRITNDENGIMEEEATAWAIEAVERMTSDLQIQASAAVQAEEDRQRLVNIENMLKQLTGQE
jgi:hypothetical protein